MLKYDFLHIVIDTSECAQFVLIRVLNTMLVKTEDELSFLNFRLCMNSEMINTFKMSLQFRDMMLKHVLNI